MSGTTSWSCALTGITAGTYTYTATATDIAGNTTLSTSFSLTRSTSAPTLSLSSSTPTLPTAGGLTNAATLDLSLTAIPTGGATSISSVEVSTDGTTYSVPTIFSAGTWNTATLPLTNGSTYTLKARATDNLGNVSTVLDIDSFTVDRTAPTLFASTPIVLSGNGTCGTLCSVGNVITATVSFTESVTGTPGLTLQVGSSERTMTCSTDTGSTRTCTYTLTGSDDGSISILANKLTGTLSDLAGNAVASLNHSAVSSPSLTIDTTAPAAPTAPDLADASDSGVVNTDNTTNITPVTFTGTAEAGSTVSLYAQTACGGSVVATTTGGSYTFTGVALTANATTTFSAKATDAAGNASPCSSNLAVTHDTIAPTGTVDTLSTSDTTPPLSGTLGETGLTVTVTVNGQGPYTAAVSGTNWTLADNTITPALAVGTYNVTLTITDAAGNVGNDSTNDELTITVVAPIVATGGTITTTPDGLYRVHTFTTSGTFTVTSGGGNVDYLVVGGGGAGGRGDNSGSGGGGGGAGRVVEGTITLPLGSISVTVGNGGTGGALATEANSSGGNSQLGSGIIATGGGRGARIGTSPTAAMTGGPGGSGGGGFRSPNAGGSADPVTVGSYGYSGGSGAGGSSLGDGGGGGGGGGAGGVGSNGAGINGGSGGAGHLSTIDGSSKYYGGGGGGGRHGTGSAGTGGSAVGGNGGSTHGGPGSDGSINSGGGGGGGAQGGSSCTLGGGRCGGAGGSGIVIIRYPI